MRRVKVEKMPTLQIYHNGALVETIVAGDAAEMVAEDLKRRISLILSTHAPREANVQE